MTHPGANAVVILCEESATIRDALRARGVDAWSCDLEPTRGDPRWHLQGDAIEVARSYQWAGMVAHPVCTYLANSGSKHLYLGCKKENGRNPVRWADMEAGAAFYRALRDGATKGAALRAAQLALLRGTTPYPYYWASFQLVGDSDAL